MGLAGGMNLYGFAGGDPVNFSDPFGLFECDKDHPADCKEPDRVLGAGCPAISDACNSAPLVPKSGKEALAKTAVVLGAAAVGFGGAALLEAVGGTAATDASISTGERQLLRDFFGQGLKGARARGENFEIPNGLTRETLNKYADVAKGAIERGIDKTGVQAERLKLIQRALGQLK